MESLDGVGDRFQKAALRVCERWGCLDFSNAGDVSNATMAAIKRRIETGGAEAIQPLLHSESPSDGFLELWARDRLDLTLEALCLRPAWSQLFTPEERSV